MAIDDNTIAKQATAETSREMNIKKGTTPKNFINNNEGNTNK